MPLQVHPERPTQPERFLADVASERLLAGVYRLVVFQLVGAHKPGRTQVTLIRPLARVLAHMHAQPLRSRAPLAAYLADVRQQLRVHAPLVVCQVGPDDERSLAHVALKLAFVRVPHPVQGQHLRRFRALAAHVTLEGALLRVPDYVAAQHVPADAHHAADFAHALRFTRETVLGDRGRRLELLAALPARKHKVRMLVHVRLEVALLFELQAALQANVFLWRITSITINRGGLRMVWDIRRRREMAIGNSLLIS